MRLIIAGGRDFTNYDVVKRELDYLLQNVTEPVIVYYGKCRGADALGERYAKDNDYPVKPFAADWTRYGKAAGPIRNRRMAQFASHAVLFWDGRSTGTEDMLKHCQDLGVNYRVVNI